MTRCYITIKTFQMEKSLLTLPLEKLVEAFSFVCITMLCLCVCVLMYRVGQK